MLGLLVGEFSSACLGTIARWPGCVRLVGTLWACIVCRNARIAAIAQLGERQTEDLKVPGSIPGLGTQLFVSCFDFVVL